MSDIPALPYPPPWQDRQTLAAHLVCNEDTVDNWAALGIIPPARKRGGKLMWKWSEVDEWLTLGKEAGKAPVSKAEEIRNGTRAEAARSKGH